MCDILFIMDTIEYFQHNLISFIKYYILYYLFYLSTSSKITFHNLILRFQYIDFDIIIIKYHASISIILVLKIRKHVINLYFIY